MTSTKIDLNKLSETTAVIVAGCFGVAKRFHDRIRGEHFFLDLRLLGRAANVGEIAHCVFGAHCFARSGLTRYYNGLILIKAKEIKLF